MKQPSGVYRKSGRRYKGDGTGIAYGSGFKVWQVHDRGYSTLKVIVYLWGICLMVMREG
jgi:hypothetical protein